MSLWLMASASAGSSRSVGMNIWDQCMGAYSSGAVRTLPPPPPVGARGCAIFAARDPAHPCGRRVSMRALLALVCLLALPARAGAQVALGTSLLRLEQVPLRVELFEARAGARPLYVIRTSLPRAAAFQVLAAERPTPLAKIVGDRLGVALNGGFYDESGRAMGLVMQDGREVEKLRRGGGSGVLTFGPRGFAVVHRTDPLP